MGLRNSKDFPSHFIFNSYRRKGGKTGLKEGGIRRECEKSRVHITKNIGQLFCFFNLPLNFQLFSALHLSRPRKILLL